MKSSMKSFKRIANAGNKIIYRSADNLVITKDSDDELYLFIDGTYGVPLKKGVASYTFHESTPSGLLVTITAFEISEEILLQIELRT